MEDLTEQQIKNVKHQIITQLGVHASILSYRSHAAREARYYWCNRGEETTTMRPVFDYVAGKIEEGIIEEAAVISRLYSEYNSVGKRKK